MSDATRSATAIFIDYNLGTAEELVAELTEMKRDYAKGLSVQSAASRVRDMARDLSDTSEKVRKNEWHRSREDCSES